MAKFTKWNNPAKKRRKKKISYDDRVTMAIREIILDCKVGYDLPTNLYEEKYNLKKGELNSWKR